MDVLYEVEDDTLVPTAYTRGPGDPRHQHAGPPSALLARAIEAAAGIADGQVVRLAIDILRPVPLAPLRTVVRTLRPGRRVEQVEAVLTAAADGTELMRARAWRMRTDVVPLPDGLGAPDPPPAPPEDCRPGVRPSFWPDGPAYADALEWRFLSGEFEQMGPAVCWTRMNVGLVRGEPITPLEHLLVMGDAASGVSSTLDWATWTFINVDYGVALERPPEGEWLAMDAVTRPGELGAGTCAASCPTGAGASAARRRRSWSRSADAVRPGPVEHSPAMALTHAGWAVRLRLPRWDDHVLERLEHAGIEPLEAPARYRTTPFEITLTTPDEAEAPATERVARALRGWTVLLPRDFVSSGPR